MEEILLHTQAFFNTFKEIVVEVRNVCLVLIAAIFIIRTGWLVLVGFSGDNSKNPPVNSILTGVLIWAVVFGYVEIMHYLTGVIDWMVNAMPTSSGEDKINNILSSLAGPRPVNPDEAGALDSIKGFLGMMSSLQNLGVNFITSGLSILARDIILFLREFILGFVLIVGPIALTLSTIPGMSMLVKKWFTLWLNVSCWAISLQLLDELITKVFVNVIGPNIDVFYTSPLFLIINIILLFMYFMIPWLTSQFTGSSVAGIFYSNVVGMITTGSRMALAGAFGAIGAIGKSGAINYLTYGRLNSGGGGSSSSDDGVLGSPASNILK